MAIHRITTIKSVFEKCVVSEELAAFGKQVFSSSGEVAEAFEYLTRETKEHCICVHLDSKNKVIAIDYVSTGSLNASILHPREVFKNALLSSAMSILLVHNHPSGDANPSKEDIEITKRIKQGGELLGIRVLDHIIVATDKYTSFADRGLMN